MTEGEEGFRVDMALSHSGSRRLRWRPVIHFGLRRDDRNLQELVRMMEDRSPRIRRAALRWYASRIHPDNSVTGPFGIAAPADNIPPGIEKLLTGMADENFNVRHAAVWALGAYVNCGDKRVTQALEKALDDTKHKVRHTAARILGVRCPGCGRTW